MVAVNSPQKAGVIAAIICSVFLSSCSSLFFQPQRTHFTNPSLKHLQYRDIYFTAADGVKLHGWFFPSQGKAKGSVLFLHGNAENISTHINGILWLIPEGYNVFAFDYRGYGRSAGSPSVEGVHLDASAAFETLLEQPEAHDCDVVVLGQSLGGTIAITTVATLKDRSRVRMIVSDSAFAGYREIAREKIGLILGPLKYPLAWFFNDSYSPSRFIANLPPTPLLIIHGEQDYIVPVTHGKSLYNAAHTPKELWIVPDAGHIEAFADPAIRQKFLDYLQKNRHIVAQP